MDCKVLMDGYEIFRGWMIEHTELDVYNYITIQSMASPFMSKPGCYDNVYQISGATLQFITKCVVGGRVMTNPRKQHHVKKKIANFYVCSLNPSAMHFMDGLLEDKPNVLNARSYEFLKQQGVYFVRVKIIKANRHSDFPLTNRINEESGVIYFTNDMDNGIVYIGKVGLED